MTIEAVPASGHVYDFDSAIGVGQALADAAGGTPAHLVRPDGTAVLVHLTASKFPLSAPSPGPAVPGMALRWRRPTGQSDADVAPIVSGWSETVEVLGALEDAARGAVSHLVRADGLSLELRSDNVQPAAGKFAGETLGELRQLRARIVQTESDPERRRLYARSLTLSHYRDSHDGRLPTLDDHVVQQRTLAVLSGLDEAGIQRTAREELDADRMALAAFPLPERAA